MPNQPPQYKPETGEILNLEIWRAGDYGDKGAYTEADLDGIVANSDATLPDAAANFDHKREGPALGQFAKLWRVGNSLYADLKNVPPEIFRSIREGKIVGRSIELYREFRGDGAKAPGKPAISGMAWLGAMPPQVKGMQPLKWSEAPPNLLTFPLDFSEIPRPVESIVLALKEKYPDWPKERIYATAWDAAKKRGLTEVEDDPDDLEEFLGLAMPTIRSNTSNIPIANKTINTLFPKGGFFSMPDKTPDQKNHEPGAGPTPEEFAELKAAMEAQKAEAAAAKQELEKIKAQAERERQERFEEAQRSTIERFCERASKEGFLPPATVNALKPVLPAVFKAEQEELVKFAEGGAKGEKPASFFESFFKTATPMELFSEHPESKPKTFGGEKTGAMDFAAMPDDIAEEMPAEMAEMKKKFPGKNAMEIEEMAYANLMKRRKEGK